MKKKLYEKPSMKVFELKQTGMLMASNGTAGLQNYHWNNEVAGTRSMTGKAGDMDDFEDEE